MRLKVSSAKWRPSCLGLSVLKQLSGISTTEHRMVTSWHGNTFHITGSFVRGICRSPVDSPHKGVSNAGFAVFFVIEKKTIIGLLSIWDAMMWRHYNGHTSPFLFHFRHMFLPLMIICFEQEPCGSTLTKSRGVIADSEMILSSMSPSPLLFIIIKITHNRKTKYSRYLIVIAI